MQFVIRKFLNFLLVNKILSFYNLKRKINKFNSGITKLILKYPQVQTISSPLLKYKK